MLLGQYLTEITDFHESLPENEEHPFYSGDQIIVEKTYLRSQLSLLH
jgi:hypothetical protein